MPSPKLKPCPRCHTARHVSTFQVFDNTYQLRFDAMCNECEFRVGRAGKSHYEAALAWNERVAAWNRRKEGGSKC